MKISCIEAVVLVGILAQVAWGGLGGSQVVMVEPSAPIPEGPPAAVAFVFRVEKDSSSQEPISEVHISFPFELSPQEESMWYEEIVPGHPAFSTSLLGRTAYWIAPGGAPDVLEIGETTHVGLVAIPYSGFPHGSVQVVWDLFGFWGARLSGEVTVLSTPVEHESWGRIKALYWDRSGGGLSN